MDPRAQDDLRPSAGIWQVKLLTRQTLRHRFLRRHGASVKDYEEPGPCSCTACIRHAAPRGTLQALPSPCCREFLKDFTRRTQHSDPGLITGEYLTNGCAAARCKQLLASPASNDFETTPILRTMVRILPKDHRWRAAPSSRSSCRTRGLVPLNGDQSYRVQPSARPTDPYKVTYDTTSVTGRLFSDDERAAGVNATRLVVRAIELRILDIDNLEPDEE